MQESSDHLESSQHGDKICVCEKGETNVEAIEVTAIGSVLLASTVDREGVHQRSCVIRTASLYATFFAMVSNYITLILT